MVSGQALSPAGSTGTEAIPRSKYICLPALVPVRGDEARPLNKACIILLGS